MMGRRDAGSVIADGINLYHEPYESEYTRIAQKGEIVYVIFNGINVTSPMEAKERGMIYVTLDKENNVKHITFYNKETGERTKQIDVIGRTHNGLIPHVHVGYEHDEHGTGKLTIKETIKTEEILLYWE
ncbi:MAG: hypothetical protein IJM15_01105 [Erysipelotrichaceae bacterium]|nr:hypothetical protein [Erysipelotrichaceae bacterium]